MPIPTSSSPPLTTPLHYSLSTKQKSKPQSKSHETRPLPPEPKFPPPPPSKAPLPKPPDLKKNKKSHPKRFTRRRKDVYLSDSDSDTDEIQSNSEEKPHISPPNRQKVPYINAVVDPFDDPHVYDSAEIVPARKKGRGGSVVKEEVVRFVDPPIETAVKYKPQPKYYENTEIEPSYDENPTLPPRQSRAPTNDSPARPPKQSPKKFSNQAQDVPSHRSTMNKPLPAPPTKQKPGPTLPPKLPPSAGQRASPVLAPKTNLKRTMQQPPSNLDQLSELASVLSNRNTARVSGGDAFSTGRGNEEIFPPPPPVMLKKNNWKQARPRNY